MMESKGTKIKGPLCRVVYGSLAIMVISVIYKIFFDPNWQVLFSASVAYASLFNRTITQHLPKLFSKSDGKVATTEYLIDKVVLESINVCNANGLFFNQAVLVSEDSSQIITIPNERINDIDSYLNELKLSDFKHNNIAIAMAGSYDWKQFLWSGVKHYEALIIEVYLSKGVKKYSFCQTIDNDSGLYKPSERGLIYQGSVAIKG